MITLFTFPAAFGLRNVSPFCLKVEMALRYLDIDFEIALESDPRKGPKDKLPFIIVDGKTIDDSELILKYLDDLTDGGLYGQLSPLESAVGTAFSRLADDHLYWLMVASRWLEDDWFEHVKTGFFSNLPPVIGPVIAKLARAQIRKTYYLQGLGRHSKDQQVGFLQRDLQAIESVVENDHYIVGQRLTVFDFSVASLLAGMLDNQPGTWVTQEAKKYPGLVTYAERVQAELGVYCRAD
jgi:glutathione S-transferase